MGILKISLPIPPKFAMVATFIALLLPTPSLPDEITQEWCIADPQAPSSLLKSALNWACDHGTDCDAIQWNQTCFDPNTLASHASYAFNKYWQNNKHKGASCFFNNAAYVTESDPSFGACHFVYVP